ncbi:MAG: hypothetical protein MJY68_08275 [Bacteroidaceae bacterium]|nr:hypothetical protein [Bacteroidaceae bacterium]
MAVFRKFRCQIIGCRLGIGNKMFRTKVVLAETLVYVLNPGFRILFELSLNATTDR